MIRMFRVAVSLRQIRAVTYPYSPDDAGRERRILNAVNMIRRAIATEISPTTTLLRAEERDNEVYLVGTSHVSEKSAQEIEELICVVRPDKVFVELDPERAAQLMRDDHLDHDPFQNRLLTTVQNLSKDLPIPLFGGGGENRDNNNNNTSLFESFFEQLRQHGILPTGTDMKSAILAAQRTGADVVYGDRPMDQTFQAVKNALHPGMLLKFMSTPIPPEVQRVFSSSESSNGNINLSGLAASAEKAKSRHFARAMLEYMEEAAPDLASAMVHQRDRIMAENLRQQCGSGRVVAVVGMVHLEGVECEWLKLKNNTGILDR